jgi:superfamily II DNA/RNA helicase
MKMLLPRTAACSARGIARTAVDFLIRAAATWRRRVFSLATSGKRRGESFTKPAIPVKIRSMPSAVSPSLAWAHPLVQEWFTARFSTPTEPQEQGWPQILAGHTTLISAPTGSGKTLAAFLACINRLVCKALAGELYDRTEVLYVSPLKALGNDIQKNLETPLGEICAWR